MLLSQIIRFLGRGKRKSFQISTLPLEVFYNLINYVQAKELINLCLTSSHMRQKIRSYLKTPNFPQNFSDTVTSSLHRSPNNEKIYCDVFTTFGRLIRICFDQEEKQACIRLLISFHQRCNRKVVEEYRGWGMLFLEVVRNWQQMDEFLFIRQFFECSGVVQRARDIIHSQEKLVADELRLRRFLRGCFLDVVVTDDARYRFRLSSILHLICRSDDELRLFLLLGAPIKESQDGNGNKFIDYSTIHIEVIDSAESVHSVLGDLPSMLAHLTITQQLDLVQLRWSDLRVFNFIETLTTYPEPWVLPNFAAFLMSSSILARLAIVTRALYDNTAEAGTTLFNCIEIALHLKMNAIVILRPTIQGLLANCPLEASLYVFREAYISAYQHILDLLPPVFEESRESIREGLEISGTLIEIGRSITGYI